MQAICQLGGWRAAADVLKLQRARPTPAQHSLEELTQQLQEFMRAAHNPSPSATGPSSSNSSNSDGVGRRRMAELLSRRRSGTQAGEQQQQQQHQQGGKQEEGAPPVRPQQPKLPTQAQLLAAGRRDLVYGMRQHGYEVVQQHLGLRPRKACLRVSLTWRTAFMYVCVCVWW